MHEKEKRAADRLIGSNTLRPKAAKEEEPSAHHGWRTTEPGKERFDAGLAKL